ncbi:MAG: hypothetical protein E7522_06210 [Ruminococcaceae bacterium]|nr:hypothetical protein [Oscillospiraceae bacterium]
MGINEIAAVAVRKIGIAAGKKMRRKGIKADPLPKTEPTIIKGDSFVSGYAVKEVMPKSITEKKYWIAGHGMGHTIDRIHDPITASAMWLGSGNSGIIHICADIIGLTNFEVNIVRDSLKEFCEKTNCKSVNISCSHTHAGFDTVGYWGQLYKLQSGKDPEYMDLLLKSLKEVAIEAYENRKPGKLYAGSISVPEAQHDKREPVILHDTLTRIKFVPDDGSTETWLMNFGAHPNTLGGSNNDCSADYPYWLRKTINDTKKVNVMFAVSAIGAVDPGDFCEDKPERTRIQGETLAKAALEISNDRELKPEITVLCQKYYAPVDNGLLALMVTIGACSAQRYPCDRGDLGIALQTEITYIKIDDLQILLLPGEPFPEVVYGGAVSAEESATGKGPEINPPALVDVVGDKDLVVFCVTNDMTGYCVVPNDYILHETQPYIEQGTDVKGRRHYHETNSLGYLTNQVIVEVVEDIMSRVK